MWTIIVTTDDNKVLKCDPMGLDEAIDMSLELQDLGYQVEVKEA